MNEESGASFDGHAPKESAIDHHFRITAVWFEGLDTFALPHPRCEIELRMWLSEGLSPQTDR